MKVLILLEWIRKGRHRDNFSPEDDSDMQEAVSVDILCSHTAGFSVLKERLLLLICLRICKMLRGLSVVFFPLHLKSNTFPDQRLWIRMVWLFNSTEQLVSSEASEIFVSAVTSVKFAFYYQISTKSLWTKKSICWSQGCVQFLSVSRAWFEVNSAHSRFLLWFAFWSSSSWSF